MPQLSIEINQNQLIQRINNVLIKKLSRFERKPIQNYCRTIFEETVIESPTWKSLLGGPDSLAADFGIRRGTNQDRLNTILQFWLDSIEVRYKINKRPRTFQFILSIWGIDASYADVTQLEAAITRNRNKKTGKIDKLPWLEWLLTKGDEEIISGYDVSYGSYKQSRSGYAQMAKGGSFSVNPSFSGRPNNNFVTQTIDTIIKSNKIENIIKEELIRTLR